MVQTASCPALAKNAGTGHPRSGLGKQEGEQSPGHPSFHELAEAYEKIDGGKGGSYAAGHNAALQRELELRDQRPYLREYNTGAGGPANSPNPQGSYSIIIKK